MSTEDDLRNAIANGAISVEAAETLISRSVPLTARSHVDPGPQPGSSSSCREICRRGLRPRWHYQPEY